MLSIATDYAQDTGDPSPYLRRIAEAGFSHVHWCHHWCTDFVYCEPEVDQIQLWLDEYGLQLWDLHGSDGVEKRWASPREYERLAGVELVKNRIEMTARLSGDVVVMHIPSEPGSDPVRRSLDEIQPFARAQGVRIAIENGNFQAIGQVLAEFGPDYVGLCYDAGHGNLDEDGLGRLEGLKERLIAIHLHDNDGTADQHRLPFTGTIDWPRLAGVLAQSAYERCITLEVGMRLSGIPEEDAFLSKAYEIGATLSAMLDRERSGKPGPDA